MSSSAATCTSVQSAIGVGIQLGPTAGSYACCSCVSGTCSPLTALASLHVLVDRATPCPLCGALQLQSLPTGAVVGSAFNPPLAVALVGAASAASIPYGYSCRSTPLPAAFCAHRARVSVSVDVLAGPGQLVGSTLSAMPNASATSFANLSVTAAGVYRLRVSAVVRVNGTEGFVSVLSDNVTVVGERGRAPGWAGKPRLLTAFLQTRARRARRWCSLRPWTVRIRAGATAALCGPT
jgi:hypothetical protein